MDESFQRFVLKGLFPVVYLVYDIQGRVDEAQGNGNNINLAYHLQDSQKLGRFVRREGQRQQRIYQYGRYHVHQLVDDLALNDQVVPLVACPLRQAFEHIQEDVTADIIDSYCCQDYEQKDDQIVYLGCRTADDTPFNQMTVNPFLYCVHK